MKRQRQGVRSTRAREETELNLPAILKAKDVYIKIYNVTETMHKKDCLASQQPS